MLTTTGTYKAEAFNSQTNTFHATSELAMQVSVYETFDNDHRVVSQTTTSSDRPSKFTFTADDAGLHRLCFTPSGPAAVSVGGWFSNAGVTGGGVKLSVDLVIGESSKIESEDKGKVDSLVTKVKELNGRLSDIRREQVFQRVSNPWNFKQPHLTRARNEKQSFEIRASRQIRRLYGGH